MAFPSPWLAASADVQRTMHIGSIAVAGDAMTNYGNRYGITDRAALIDYFRYQQEARASWPAPPAVLSIKTAGHY